MGWYNANEGGYAWSQAIGGLTRDAELMLSGYGFVRGAVGGTGTLGRNLFAVEFAPGPWSLMLGGERALSTSSVTISYGIKWSGRIESYRSLNRAFSGEDPTP